MLIDIGHIGMFLTEVTYSFLKLICILQKSSRSKGKQIGVDNLVNGVITQLLMNWLMKRTKEVMRWNRDKQRQEPYCWIDGNTNVYGYKRQKKFVMINETIKLIHMETKKETHLVEIYGRQQPWTSQHRQQCSCRQVSKVTEISKKAGE